jgi:hypothetical protein
MELIAALSCFPSADVLQWCGANRFDGHLAFRRSDRIVKLSCNAGRIIQVSSTARRESFGRHLFSQGLVTERDLDAADNEDQRARLGEKLVEIGLLTRHQVRVALVDHTLNLACTIARWTSGVVSAHAAKLRPLSDIEPQPLDPFFAVMEAARREDELGRLRVFLPHDNVELGPGDAEELEGLSPAMLRTLEVFETGDTLDRLYEKLGGSRFLFLKSVGDLITAAVLRTVAIGPRPPQPEPRSDSLVDVLLDQRKNHRLRA